MFYLILLTAVAGLSAIAGACTRTNALHQRLVPFSGGVLLGVACFWIAPELNEAFGAGVAIGLLASGVLLVWVIDRFVYPLCPSCSPAHDHDHCHTDLHGFAAPLVGAAALHSFFDGWGIGVAQQTGLAPVAAGLLTGIGIHKLPEAFSLGIILRAALPTRRSALLWGVAAEAPMLVGGWAALLASRHVPLTWMVMCLALAAASFLYLGYHAIHGDFRRVGPGRSLGPAAAGMFSAGLVALLVQHH